MASIRRRRIVRKRAGREWIYVRYVIDYRDANGRRRLRTCPAGWTKDQVKRLAAELSLTPGGDPRITFETVAEEWYALNVARGVKPQSLADYRGKLNRHILPRFGAAKLSAIKKAHLHAFLVERLNAGIAPRTVNAIRGRLHSIFAYAVARDYLPANPCLGLGRELSLARAPGETVRAFTREQLKEILALAHATAPDLYPLLLLLARTGLRIAEATALQWNHVRLAEREIEVRQIWVSGHLQERLKGKQPSRVVDVSAQLANELLSLRNNRVSSLYRWVFVSRHRRPFRARTVANRFKKLLRKAGLPEHFTPHSLRHTYARLMLENGQRLEYVQRQLGHESIAMTNDLYGRWARLSNKAAVDALDDGLAVNP